MVIKRITAANENLTSGRSRVEAQQYWADSHGKLIANNPAIMRYHHYFSLPEAYENDPKPSYIGISMFWRSDLDTMFAQRVVPSVPANGTDDRQLFDRDPYHWPTDFKPYYIGQPWVGGYGWWQPYIEQYPNGAGQILSQYWFDPSKKT